METRIVWTPEAADDLEGAFEYLKEESPQYAAQLVDRLMQKIETLLTYTQRARPVPEADDEQIREVFVDKYRVVYHIGPGEVTVVRIIHMSRYFKSIP